jgi:hypothetical protein
MKEKFAEQDLITKREKDALIMENKTLEDSFLALRLDLEKVNDRLGSESTDYSNPSPN